jgi:hypothetical protein
MMKRICVVCGEDARPFSWVDGRTTCAGHCYRVEVARVLSARRQPVPAGMKAPPLDRSPLPATDAVTEGTDPAFRVPRPRRPPRSRGFVCDQCGATVTTREPFRAARRVFCTLTCMQEA